MMGYLFNEDKTAETFDADGWLKSGDIASIDADGFVSITGRIKELIITAGGENIAPLPIEDNIKKELPDAVSNVMVVGDGKKFLTCLVCCIKVDGVNQLNNINHFQDNIEGGGGSGDPGSLRPVGRGSPRMGQQPWRSRAQDHGRLL